jgi:hypothetical protein
MVERRAAGEREITSTSLPGSSNISTPSHALVIKQAAAPAASKTRVGGENP